MLGIFGGANGLTNGARFSEGGGHASTNTFQVAMSMKRSLKDLEPFQLRDRRLGGVIRRRGSPW